MARRVKANGGRQESGKRKNGEVKRRSMNTPRAGWTEDEAVEMLRAGYDIERVSERTGYAVKWLEAQPTPRSSLAERAAAARGLKPVARER